MILVTGARDLADPRPVAEALSQYQGAVLVVHGAACGTDALAAQYAAGRGWGMLPMPAQWELYGNAAGPRRNQVMLNVTIALGDCGYRAVVHAFPGPRSRGTWDMVRRAREAGLDVRVHDVCC